MRKYWAKDIPSKGALDLVKHGLMRLSRTCPALKFVFLSWAFFGTLEWVYLTRLIIVITDNFSLAASHALTLNELLRKLRQNCFVFGFLAKWFVEVS